jgi:hypothetical protein
MKLIHLPHCEVELAVESREKVFDNSLFLLEPQLKVKAMLESSTFDS